MKSRVTIISDTHWRHGELRLPPGDLLIHCGDMFSLSGRSQSIRRMDEWFGEQPFATILCTGGNHDRMLQSALLQDVQPFRNAHFLNDETIEVRGLKIHGAPWVPDLPTHAFYKNEKAIAEHWEKIPSGLDLLVTHTPPRGVLDRSSTGQLHGCATLPEALRRAAPKVHCFGHVHASAGSCRSGGTLFVNGSSVQNRSGALRRPVTLTLSPGERASLSMHSRLRQFIDRIAYSAN